MASARGSLSYKVERNLRTIFKRCVQCPTETPTCPDCSSGEICSLVPQDCNACAHMTCIANPSPAPDSNKPNVGAIAGGVVGGVVFVAIIMFFLWRFWIKKKREQQELEDWEDDEIAQQKGTQQFSAMRSDAASTRTRGSIAGSFLSRASNIIQIAYIPGVTNRSGNGSGHNSSFLENTPVPPIPAQYAQSPMPKSPLSNEGDALFFRPGSLRGSTYSDGSSIKSGNNRDTQYTRQSITPSLARSSMMSETVYMDDATTEPMPATHVWRAAPKMVSVKGSPASSPSEEIGSGGSPQQVQVMMPGQPSATSSPRSGNGSFVKAKQVTVANKKGRFPIRQNSDASTPKHAPAVPSPLVETATDSDDEDEHARARRSLINATSRAADPAPLIQPMDSPFFDASETQTAASSSAALRPNPYAAMSANVGGNGRVRRAGSRGPGGLSAVIEEAARRASQEPEHDGLGTKRDPSPFSDAHATK